MSAEDERALQEDLVGFPDGEPRRPRVLELDPEAEELGGLELDVRRQRPFPAGPGRPLRPVVAEADGPAWVPVVLTVDVVPPAVEPPLTRPLGHRPRAVDQLGGERHDGAG